MFVRLTSFAAEPNKAKEKKAEKEVDEKEPTLKKSTKKAATKEATTKEATTKATTTKATTTKATTTKATTKATTTKASATKATTTKATTKATTTKKKDTTTKKRTTIDNSTINNDDKLKKKKVDEKISREFSSLVVTQDSLIYQDKDGKKGIYFFQVPCSILSDEEAKLWNYAAMDIYVKPQYEKDDEKDDGDLSPKNKLIFGWKLGIKGMGWLQKYVTFEEKK